MTLLEQLEGELARVRKQLQQLTREQTVLAEQITRLRTGAAPEVVHAALRVALGVRPDVSSPDHGDRAHVASSPAERLPAARAQGKGAGTVLNGHGRLRTPNTAA